MISGAFSIISQALILGCFPRVKVVHTSTKHDGQVHKKRYMFELRNKVCSEYIGELAMDRDIRRVLGVGLLYSELVQGIPLKFPYLIACMSSIRSALVFVAIKVIHISRVFMEESFLFCHLEPREYRIFWLRS
ncbi:Potassium transporter [Arachis hypogaea]|nr:Potassium transporter [Arachis hypogaea]